MAVTKDNQTQDQSDYADQFNAADAPKTEQSEDEAFGLGPEAAADAPTGGGDAADATDDGAATPAAAAAEPSADEQRLKEWEDALKQKEADLDARDASTTSTNAQETQTSGDGGGDGDDDGESAADEAAEKADPEKALADDFGQEFVELIIALVKKVCKGEVGAGISGVEATVNAVIEHLQTERHASHFKAIESAHKDYNEVIGSPEFEAYRAAQEPATQSDIDRVIASGSAQEIIDMLTKFKDASAGGGDSGADDDAMDAAAGVRSSGLRLPPPAAQAGGYEDSWNEH